jgi:hypothetical protein
MTDYPIDFVIAWVDGGDPEWQREKARFKPKIHDDNRTERYRNWQLLKYWFRAVEKNAPWVNRIHFVTWGHVPSWLDTDNPKINVVRHADFIPDEYLPTFNSNSIELNLHRIKELAEHFVLFNDDMYLINPVDRDDFFSRGLPRGMAVFNPPTTSDDVMQAILSNDIRLINRNFDKKSTVRGNSRRFMNIRYGKYIVRTLLCLPWKRFVGFYNRHLASPFLKSSFECVWEKEYAALDRTSRNRFRSTEDINQYAFTYWQYCTGNFVPSAKIGEACDIFDDIKKSCALIRDRRRKCICINDSDRDEGTFLNARERLAEEFEKRFPDKCSFEK